MIQIDHLSFGYGRGRRDSVYSDLSLQLRPGRIAGLLGKNGTGKSTLFHLICGLLRPKGGRVTIDGIDTFRRSPATLSQVFLVPEEFDLPRVSMRTYVDLQRGFYPNFSDEVLAECLDAFELPGDLQLGSLSMGQKKKAFISFALATSTPYLLLDEPTNGLDIPSKSMFRRIVTRHMNDERSVVISTHQVRDVEEMLDHLVLIDNRRVLLDAGVDEISSRFRFEHLPAGATAEGVLYAMPSLSGQSIVRRREAGEAETPVSIELLFNALLTDNALFDKN